MPLNGQRISLLLAVAAALLVPGCGDSSSDDLASGSATAECAEARPGAARLGTSTRVGREFLRAGNFGMLRGPGTFSTAQPAGTVLGKEFSEVLIASISATVVGTDSATVEIPEDERDNVGLLFGSVRGYEQPLAKVTFESCPGQEGTSWPGGFAIKKQGPFTLLVTPEGSDEALTLEVR